MGVEERLAALEAQLEPQALRTALERTWNPRGLADELLVQDAAGTPLERRKTVQFLGGATDDPANKRTLVSGSAPVADLRWSDPFAADRFASDYADTFNLTVSGGAVSWNPATGNGGWARKTGLWYDTVQSIKVTQPTGNSGRVHLLTRIRKAMPAALSLRWNTSTGALEIHDLAAGATLASSATTYVPAAGAVRWLVLATIGDRLFGCISTQPPDAMNDAAQLVADVSWALASGDERPFLVDSGVGFYVLCTGSPLVGLTDYRVWHP